MLLYKKDMGRPIKTVLSFYNLRVFLFVLVFMLFISKYSCIGYIIQLYRLHNRFNGNTSNKILRIYL